MVNYKLTNKAVEDLSKIWYYTFEIWSIKQADKYYNSLITTCQEITENPDLGKIYPGVKQSLFGIKNNKHIIFCRKINDDNIEITRILHERMDLKKRIKE